MGLTYLFRLHAARDPLPFFLVQNALAQAYLLRRYLDALILLDIFHTLFQGHLLLRHDPYGVIAATGAHVGQLLSFRSIYDKVAWFDVLGDDLAGVYVFARIDEEGTAL